MDEPDPADPRGIPRPTDEELRRVVMGAGPYGLGRHYPPTADLFPPPPPPGTHPAVGEMWVYDVSDDLPPRRRWWQRWRR